MTDLAASQPSLDTLTASLETAHATVKDLTAQVAVLKAQLAKERAERQQLADTYYLYRQLNPSNRAQY